MAGPVENEGFRMLDDFVCDALHAAGVPQADATKSGKNEGARLVEELVFDAKRGSKIEDKCFSANGSKAMPRRLSDCRLADLVPETRDWNNGKGIDLEGWIGCVGSFEHAIAYGTLFWPDFTEFDHCVLFSGFSEEGYHGFMRQTGGNKKAVEAVMNHRHILDLFSSPEREPTREQILYLGRLLEEMWTAKLQHDFPNRHVVVVFSHEPSGDLLDYEITFFQESHLP